MIYAVVSGRETGVFKDPERVKKATHGVKGSYVHNFKDDQEDVAHAYVEFGANGKWKTYNSKEGFDKFLEWYEQSKKVINKAKEVTQNSSQEIVDVQEPKQSIQIKAEKVEWEIPNGKASESAITMLKKTLEEKDNSSLENCSQQVAEVKQEESSANSVQQVAEDKQETSSANSSPKVLDSKSRDELIHMLTSKAIKESDDSMVSDFLQFMKEVANHKEFMQVMEQFTSNMFKETMQEVLANQKVNEAVLSKKEVVCLSQNSDKIRVNVNPTDWEIFTDGSFFPFSQKAGYCAILILGKKDDMPLQISGGVLDLVSSYQVEEYAIFKALEKLDTLRPYGDVHFYCDCLPLVKLLNNFLKDENAIDVNSIDDIMKEILQYLKYRDKSKKYEFHHVPGHSGIKFNEQCDKIARLENELL